MPSMSLVPFSQIKPDDAPLVGGKGLSLGLLASARLPVPPGFTLTTDVYRRLQGRSLADEPELLLALERLCHEVGGPFAVRSSATAEDGATTSFAGQQETFLGLENFPAVCQAIERCWASLDGERAIAYRHRQGVRDEIHMAVVVQRLVAAEVAGVLFTQDPLDPTGSRMLVEASWGLGETVVSGRVTPDRFHLDRNTGAVLDRHIATKTVQRIATGEIGVAKEKQNIPCLTDRLLAELAELGRKVESFHGTPRDVEWAYAEGQFWLLQSRPITTVGAVEREQLRREEIATLAKLAAPDGTIWSRFNLAEVLPTPTPLTWSIISRYLMSGKGGFGLMYRDLGYDPDPLLDHSGVFDLVCGRPYCNLSREPKLHYQDLPLEHSLKQLKADPKKALYPTPHLNLTRLPWHFWLLAPLHLPRIAIRMTQGAFQRQHWMKHFANRYRNEIAPPFRSQVEHAARQDLSALDNAALLHFISDWIRRTLVDFARESLKPTALAALAMSSLEEKLATVLGRAARDCTRELVIGARPDSESDLAGAIHSLASGKLDGETFLLRFGHRGPDEMELASPRWSEDPTRLEHPGTAKHKTFQSQTIEERLSMHGRLNAEQRQLLLPEVTRLHDYLGLRETAKHDLLRGYFHIRRGLVELDRRFNLAGGIFFLTFDELASLLSGTDLGKLIASRRQRRTLALSLEVPPVLYSDDLEAIGRPATLDGATSLSGVPLSAGIAEGPALVLREPHVEFLPEEGYILVCPSTDPAWVPLFVQARGLVMETGGVLSHGAIVAREFGLPAVAGLPGVLEHMQTGQRIRVDGTHGTVTIVGEGEKDQRSVSSR